MTKNEKKHKLKNGIIVFLSGLVILAVTATAFAVSKIDSYELNSLNYQIASVGEEGTVETQNKTSLVSSFVEAEGLEITVEEDSKVGYVVHYYDENKEYLSSTGVLDVDYDLTQPEDAKYVRIEIVPTNDNYISIFEKAEYANQINVNVAR